jgi:hypothetical protein
MPAQDRVRGDQAMAAQRSRQPSDQGGAAMGVASDRPPRRAGRGGRRCADVDRRFRRERADVDRALVIGGVARPRRRARHEGRRGAHRPRRHRLDQGPLGARHAASTPTGAATSGPAPSPTARRPSRCSTTQTLRPSSRPHPGRWAQLIRTATPVRPQFDLWTKTSTTTSGPLSA